MDITLETVVSAVTVYPDRARIRCHGETELTEGKHRLLVEQLPLALQPDSVRVSGEGTARVRLLSVDIQRHYYEATPAARAGELEQQIEALEDEGRRLEDRAAGLSAQAEYLDGMRRATVQYAKGIARGETSVEDQAKLLRFLSEQDAEVRAGLRAVAREQRDLDRKLERLRRELNELRSQRARQRYQARIELEVLSEGDFQSELSYVVTGAGWQPLYDLRLLEIDNGRQLEMTTIAEVKQNTGQDWDGVALTLSTARPALNQRLPELRPWYIDIYRPRPPQPTAPRQMMRAAAPAAADMELSAAVMAESSERPTVEAEVAMATAQAGDTAVRFAVPGKSTIPSDGSPHKTTVNQIVLSPRLDYLAVPKHTDAVYRRVTSQNTTAGPWLPGPVNLFVSDEYIGNSHIDFTPRGDEVELLLGVEERVTVERELVRREVDKQFLRDRRQMNYGYEIRLQNLLPDEAVIELHDHIPVARHEEIKVKLEQATPEPGEKSDLNLLEWRLTLGPDVQETVRYYYSVAYPRSMEVTGLLD